MIKILKMIRSFFRKSDVETSSKAIDFDAELDMGQIQDLSQQKQVCFKMFTILQGKESIVKNRFIIAQTVSDFLESDEKVRAHVGEFVGYHFGAINHNMFMIDSAMSNLKNFHDGHLDAIDPPARGMYVSIWYNIALANLELMEDSMIHLESLESDLVEKVMADQDTDNIILKRGTLH